MELEEDQVNSYSSQSQSDSSQDEILREEVIEEDGETSFVLVPRNEVSYNELSCMYYRKL